MTKCQFEIWTDGSKDNIVAIANRNRGAMSVTNDAEGAIWRLHEMGLLSSKISVVYRDSDGNWDELRHDGAGGFLGFRHLGASSIEEARQKIRRG